MKTFVGVVKFAEHVCPDHPDYMCKSCKKKKTLAIRRFTTNEKLTAYIKGRR